MSLVIVLKDLESFLLVFLRDADKLVVWVFSGDKVFEKAILLLVRVMLEIRQRQTVLKRVNQRVQSLEYRNLVLNFGHNKQHSAFKEHMCEYEHQIFKIYALQQFPEVRRVNKG